MKNNNYYLFILFLTIISFSKSYSQEIATVSGGNATGTGGSSSYSIGQTTFTSQTSSGGLITLGVQQPYEIVTLGNDNVAEINLVMSAYPNPTTNLLNLVVSDDKWNNLSCQLFDTNGRIVSNLQKITASETSVTMQELQQGIYFLSVNNENKTIKTFKIIKK
ncbi:MAG: T9SS type A sorting domain-containing protein [Flavobacteriaceae bacterium]|nr:T9SS type A sorting domain-containing protein [Flavobacteriaceae bacterium]